MKNVKYGLLTFFILYFLLPVNSSGEAKTLCCEKALNETTPITWSFFPPDEKTAFATNPENSPVLLAQTADKTAEKTLSTNPLDPTGSGEERSFPTAIAALALGAAYWPSLHDIQTGLPSDPNAGGSPRAWGGNVELAFHFNAYHWNRWNLLMGGDLGFLFHRNTKTFKVQEVQTGDIEKARFVSTLIHVTPSLKLIGDYQYLRPFMGAGMGLYNFTFSAHLEDSLGGEIKREVDKNAFGGYVSLGFDIPFQKSGKGFLLRIEDKVHFVDFGKINNNVFSTGSEGLRGPINVIQLGIAYGF